MTASWESRHPGVGSELTAGGMTLATTDQSYRGCGWCWHVSTDHNYGRDELQSGGDAATETEAKAAAIAWARDYCQRTLAALPETEAATS